MNTQKNRANISIAPDELKKMVAVFNLLPKNSDALRCLDKDLEETQNRFNLEFTEHINFCDKKDLTDAQISDGLQKIRAKYDEKTLEIVTSDIGAKNVAALNQTFFTIDRVNLRQLISEKLLLLKFIRAFGSWDTGHHRRFKEFELTQPVINFSFNADTSLKWTEFSVLEILSKNKIPLERIRICPISVCENIFWAKRTESPACSPEHVNTFNQRKTRAKARIKKLQEDFDKELAKFRKLREEFGFPAISSEQIWHLISNQSDLVDKIDKKLTMEKRKYESI